MARKNQETVKKYGHRSPVVGIVSRNRCYQINNGNFRGTQGGLAAPGKYYRGYGFNNSSDGDYDELHAGHK